LARAGLLGASDVSDACAERIESGLPLYSRKARLHSLG